MSSLWEIRNASRRGRSGRGRAARAEGKLAFSRLSRISKATPRDRSSSAAATAAAPRSPMPLPRRPRDVSDWLQRRDACGSAREGWWFTAPRRAAVRQFKGAAR